MVKSEMVGEIIGRKGRNIRKIKKKKRERVDVNRKDNVG
jgi:ribosomal protein S3